MSRDSPRLVRLRLTAKAITPPIVWSGLKAAKEARRRPDPDEIEQQDEAEQPDEPALAASLPEWEYVPEGWARAAGGWDVDAIARVYAEKWPSFLAATSGPGLLGVNHETPLGRELRRDDLDAQQMVLAYGYALALAARGRQRVSVLDWGGGPGHYAVLARALLPGAELDYHSRDLPALVALGRRVSPRDSFHGDDECLARTYDLVVASSSIHYVERWQETLQALAGAVHGYLYLARVPVAQHSPSFVVLQRAQAYGYETEYLGWVLEAAEVLAEAQRAGLELVREIKLPAWFSAAGAPEDPVEHRAYLFGRPGVDS